VWYRLIQEAMIAAGATARADGGLTLTEGDWPPNAATTPKPQAENPVLPDWIIAPAAVETRPEQPINPSKLGGAKALPGDFTTDDDNRAAMDRGTRLHLLLEHLPNHPPAEWPRIASALLPDTPDCAELLAEAAAVITQHPALFSVDSLAEAPL